AVDPFAGRGEECMRRVQGIEVGGETIGARVENGALESRVELFSRTDIEPVGWSARRTVSPSVYAVRYAYRLHAVEFGPTWYVQLDERGLAPEGSGGVVPSNALSEHLHRASLDDELRPLNRSDEVLEALTEHRFEQGTRLGAALLIHFRGGESAFQVDDMLGWLVVPERTDDVLAYRAYFQWREDGAVQDAWWEVNLTSREFQPGDIQANRITAQGAELGTQELVAIRPRTLDLDIAPADESNPRRRALRWVLADERRVEAVRALLTYRGLTNELQYDGWQLRVTDERNVFDVACRFREGDDEQRVSWRVSSLTGEATPTSDLAQMAELALRIPTTTVEEASD
ncbi:MAG: hypothetical protein ACJA1R_002310, partial [Flavobacteriales bacterium]